TVLRSIRRLKEHKEFYNLFNETYYEHNNTRLPMFFIEREGFPLLAARFEIKNHKKLIYYFKQITNITDMTDTYQKNNAEMLLDKNRELLKANTELNHQIYDMQNR